ncbi:MAG TPA: hypothetical protein VJ762_10195, partial [Sphingobium sp.]|nr:hypothetical protein [Sphingobium sp.]
CRPVDHPLDRRNILTVRSDYASITVITDLWDGKRIHARPSRTDWQIDKRLCDVENPPSGKQRADSPTDLLKTKFLKLVQMVEESL